MTENELATTNTNNILNSQAGAMVCSIKADPTDRQASAKIYNAMNNPTHRVNDYINKEIDVTDFLIEMTDILNDETGEVSTVPRVVLIDADGESYQSVSIGMANVVRNLVNVCGMAPWNPPVTIRIKQQPTKRGSMLTADMVG